MSDTLQSYDDLPYDSRPIALTQVETLAARARLLGADSPDPAGCRVLELGCAAGGNLLPQAIRLPDARFVGIDLSREQVRAGRARIDQLGLGNLDLRHGDILALDERELGQFDYVIAHGVFSWVPQAVRERILELCRRLLTPRGLAFVSYNCLPGFHVRAMTREILLHRCPDSGSAVERLRCARRTLDALDEELAQRQEPAQRALLHEVRQLQQARDSYLYHEYLEAENRAFSFTAFANLAARFELAVMGEADLSTLALIDPPADSDLNTERTLAGREQWQDALGLRPFRQSLLCRAPLPAEPDPITAAETLFWQAELSLDDSVENPRARIWHGGQGKRVTVDDPSLNAVLAQLGAAFPGAVSSEQLLADIDPPASRHDLLHSMLALARAGILRPLVRAPLFSTRVAPRLTPLARLEVEAGQDFVSSPHTHAPLELDGFSHALLAALRDADSLDELLRRLEQRLSSDPLLWETLGLAALSEANRGAVIAANTQRLLDLFARHGVLAAEQ